MSNVNAIFVSKTIQVVVVSKKTEDYENVELKTNMQKVRDTLLDVGVGKITDPLGKELVLAFVSENPIQGIRRLIEMRKSKIYHLEDPKSNIPYVHRWLLSALTNSMTIKVSVWLQVCLHYLDGDGVKLSLEELKTVEFLAKKDATKDESLTATAIGSHLAILNNICNKEELKSRFGGELRELNFYEILEPYSMSKYKFLANSSQHI